MKKVIAVVGPTASGKTHLAVDIALAVNGEVICADSMQVYKNMPIANAAVTEDEKRGVVHHLTEFLDSDKGFSVAQYVALAGRCIDDICSRGKTPIIVGGTGLFIDSLLNNVEFSSDDEFDSAYHEELKNLAKEKGNEYLYSLLVKTDPKWAKRIHPNNIKRVIRALEFFHNTGTLMSDNFETSRNGENECIPCYVGINYKDRNILYDRVNKRVDIMLEKGLLEEAKRCIATNTATSSQAIGHKELTRYLNGEVSLEQAVEKLKQSTRRYAKRQLTWLRPNESVHWFYPDADENYVKHAIDLAVSFLKGEI